ncbi:hypothetical protein SUGI_1082610 [Cryptomeria japonica]|nr:hypothetical protein SUGI_1082610 [Cryptomeria japonica]
MTPFHRLGTRNGYLRRHLPDSSLSTALSVHQWSSGRIVPCHGTDPGSIPGCLPDPWWNPPTACFRCKIERPFMKLGTLITLTLTGLFPREDVVTKGLNADWCPTGFNWYQ